MRYRPAYLLPRIARRLVPEKLALRLISRRRLSDHDIYFGSQLYYQMIQVARDWDSGFSLRGSTVLETGSGVYNPSAAPLLLNGATQFILLEPYLGGSLDLARYNARHEALLRMAAADSEYPLPADASPDDWLAPSPEVWPARVKWLERLWEDSELQTASVDCICSISVLEHLRAPEAIVMESARILRPGGWMLNHVDLRDHFFKYPYEMLKYSDRQWQTLTTGAGGGGYLNRWRLDDWLECLARHGFETRVLEFQTDDGTLERERPYFDPRFRDRPDRELRILRAGLVSRRL